MASSHSGVQIPCIAARGLVFSAWTPSPEELAAINGGSPVWLVQRGPYIPDMAMRVGSELEVIPHDLVKHAIDEAQGNDPYEQAAAIHRNQPSNLLGYAVMFTVPILFVIFFACLIWR